MNKRYIAANDLLLDSFQLAANIIDSGFRPDFLVGLWRGGSAVGIAVQEGLDFLGCKTDHIAIRTSYRGQEGYTEMIDKAGSIRVHGLRYLHERVCAENSMLIVDDVYSTGSSVNAVIKSLSKKSRTEKTIRAPEFYVHETADWLILPYELSGLSLEELRQHKPEIQPVIDRLSALVDARKNKPAA
jgi:hypoxanthine phosphoribosyltransferase